MQTAIIFLIRVEIDQTDLLLVGLIKTFLSPLNIKLDITQDHSLGPPVIFLIGQQPIPIILLTDLNKERECQFGIYLIKATYNLTYQLNCKFMTLFQTHNGEKSKRLPTNHYVLLPNNHFMITMMY